MVERLLAKQVDGAVACDPVEPWAQRDFAPGAVPQGDESLEEGLLHGVLRAWSSHQVKAVELERALVAAHDLGEGALRARPGERHQTVIARVAKRARRKGA